MGEADIETLKIIHSTWIFHTRARADRCVCNFSTTCCGFCHRHGFCSSNYSGDINHSTSDHPFTYTQPYCNKCASDAHKHPACCGAA